VYAMSRLLVPMSRMGQRRKAQPVLAFLAALRAANLLAFEPQNQKSTSQEI
jgi:hypothetical protein